MPKCVIDFAVDDTAPSIFALVDRLQPILGEVGESIELDFSACSYLGPDAAAVVAPQFLKGAKWGIAFRSSRRENRRSCAPSGHFRGLTVGFKMGLKQTPSIHKT